MKIGFALIISQEELDKIILVENNLHEEASFHSKLSIISNLPHTTIFQGNFVDNFDYKEVALSLVKFIQERFYTKLLTFTGIQYVPEGWYFLMCKKTEQLVSLHNFALSLCKPFVIIDELSQYDFDKLSKAQQKGLKEFGYRYSGDAYMPHITIGRNDFDLNDQVLSSLSASLSNFPSSVSLDKLTVYEMGMDGTHAKTLYEITL